MSTQGGENEWFYDGMEVRHKQSLREFVIQKCAPSVCIFLLIHSQLYNMHSQLLQSVHILLKNL